jgi:hypothetical protein
VRVPSRDRLFDAIDRDEMAQIAGLEHFQRYSAALQHVLYRRRDALADRTGQSLLTTTIVEIQQKAPGQAGKGPR